MTTTNGFLGQVGMAFRELDEQEFEKYCIQNLTVPNEIPVSSSQRFNFTTNLYLRTIISGCYYLDQNSGEWSNEGVDIQRGTALLYLNCSTSHLTQFAGGFVVLPPSLDFNNAFANASPLQNPTIYATVIGALILYIFLALWSLYMDKKDRKRIGITVLIDPDHIQEMTEHSEDSSQSLENVQNRHNVYFYEVNIFTGSRLNAETDSRVFYFIC